MCQDFLDIKYGRMENGQSKQRYDPPIYVQISCQTYRQILHQRINSIFFFLLLLCVQEVVAHFNSNLLDILNDIIINLASIIRYNVFVFRCILQRFLPHYVILFFFLQIQSEFILPKNNFWNRNHDKSTLRTDPKNQGCRSRSRSR